jgi:hypothetical protein
MIVLSDDPGMQRQIATFLTPSNIRKDWTCTMGWTLESAVNYLPSSCRQANLNKMPVQWVLIP